MTLTRPRTLLDAFPHSPARELLGFHLLQLDHRGHARVRFDGRPEFTNPAGYLQGGILTAMLDETMGPAAWAACGGEFSPLAIDVHVAFLAPARPGPLFGEGEVLQMGRPLGFLSAVLTDADGRPVARASASARMVRAGATEACG